MGIASGKVVEVGQHKIKLQKQLAEGIYKKNLKYQ